MLQGRSEPREPAQPVTIIWWCRRSRALFGCASDSNGKTCEDKVCHKAKEEFIVDSMSIYRFTPQSNEAFDVEKLLQK